MQAGNACLLTSRTQICSDVILRSVCRGLQQQPRHLSASSQQQTVLQARHSTPGCTPCNAASAASWQHAASILDADVHMDMQELLLDQPNSHLAATPRSSGMPSLQDCTCGTHTHADNSRTSNSNGKRYVFPRSMTPGPAGCSSRQDVHAADVQHQQLHPTSTNAASCLHVQQQLEMEQQCDLQAHRQEMLLQHTRLGSLGDMLVVQDMSLSSSEESDCSSDDISSTASTADVAAAVKSQTPAATEEQNTGEQDAVVQTLKGDRRTRKQQLRAGAAASNQQQQQQRQSLQQTAVQVLQEQHQQFQILQKQTLPHVQQRDGSWAGAPATTQQQQHGHDRGAGHVHWLPQQQQWHDFEQRGPANASAWPQQAQAGLQQQLQYQDVGPVQQQQQQGQLQLSHQHHHQQQQQQPQQQQAQLHWQHQARLQQAQASELLSTHIAAAASWQEVRQLLDTHEPGPVMQALHVVQLLLRLDQLLLHHPQPGGAAVPAARHEQAEYVELVQSLLRMAGHSVQQLTQHELPPLVAAAARLPIPPVSKPWCVRIMWWAYRIMPKFTAEGIATLVWGFAKLGMNFRADFTAKVLQEFQLKLTEASPRALAVMLHGLAGVHVRPEGMWVGVYCHRLQTQLAQFSGKDLCMCLWGLVQLRHVVPGSLQAAALKRLIAVLPRCSSHEAALSVWALAKLGLRFGGSSTSRSGGIAVDQQLQQQRQRQQQQHGYRQQQYRTCHKLGKQQAQLLQRLKPLLAQLSGRDLTMLLYGLALQRSTPPPDWQAAALAAALARMHQLNGQGLSNLLYAVGMLKWQPSRQWQVEFWSALVTQVQMPQQQQQKQVQQQQQQHSRLKQQQRQGERATNSWDDLLPGQHVSGIQAGGFSGLGSRASAPLSGPEQAAGFASRTWELLFEGQRLLGWRLSLQQLQLLQQQGQLHRLRQARLGSWARQAGLAAAAAAASARESAPGQRRSTRTRAVGGNVQQHQQQQQPAVQPQRRQLFRAACHPAQQQQVQQQQQQQQQQQVGYGTSGSGSAGNAAVVQLNVSPPLHRPAAAAAAVQQPSSADAS